MATSDFIPEVEIWPFCACAIKKICNITLIYGRIAENFARKSGSRNTIMTSDLRAEVEIWPFRACVKMHPAIGTTFVHCGLGYGADITFHRTYF